MFSEIWKVVHLFIHLGEEHEQRIKDKLTELNIPFRYVVNLLYVYLNIHKV